MIYCISSKMHYDPMLTFQKVHYERAMKHEMSHTFSVSFSICHNCIVCVGAFVTAFLSNLDTKLNRFQNIRSISHELELNVIQSAAHDRFSQITNTRKTFAAIFCR